MFILILWDGIQCGSVGRSAQARRCSRLPPLTQLLPGLDQFLHRAGRGKGVAVDDAAFAIRAVVKLSHTMLTQERKVVHDLIQVLAGPDLFFVAGIRTTCHDIGKCSMFRFLFA